MSVMTGRKNHLRRKNYDSNIDMGLTLEFLWGAPNGAYSFNLEVVGDWA